MIDEILMALRQYIIIIIIIILFIYFLILSGVKFPRVKSKVKSKRKAEVVTPRR